jgi:hypothetical protein
MFIFKSRFDICILLVIILSLFLCVAVVSAGSTTTYVFGNGGTLIGDGRVLPNSNAGLPGQGHDLAINASPGQYEAFSFVLQPNVAVSDMSISATDLSDGNGHTLSKYTLDIKGVKVWYQADNSLSDSWYDGTKGHYLTPELLLKDLSLIRVDYNAQTNDIKLINNSGVPWYRPVDGRISTVIPSGEHIYDTPAADGGMQPFSVPAGNNQQIWVTAHIPDGQPAGTYTGQITIHSSTTDTATLNVIVRVLPFALLPTPLEYGMYYTTTARSTDPANWKPDDGTYAAAKPASIIADELQDMKIHGIQYPTTNNAWGVQGTSAYTDLAKRLQIQQQSGLPTDKLYAFNNGNVLGGYLQGGNQNTLKTNILAMQNLASIYGFTTVYEYGQDEPTAAEIAAETPSFTTVIENNGKTFFASSQDGRAEPIAALTSLVILNGVPSVNSAAAERLRAINPAIKVMSYNIPQSGVENQKIYRKNYGLVQVQKGYDGGFIWAYMVGYGSSVWNDYDSSQPYRTENFAYPATDGCIDTIQFEGLREGIDDTRYVAVLDARTGSSASSMSVINAGISGNKDPSEIRNSLIAQIMTTEPQTQTPSPTPSATPSPTATTPTPTLTQTVTQTPSPTQTGIPTENPTEIITPVDTPDPIETEIGLDPADPPGEDIPVIKNPSKGAGLSQPESKQEMSQSIMDINESSPLGGSDDLIIGTFEFGMGLLAIIVIVMVSVIVLSILSHAGLIQGFLPDAMRRISISSLLGFLVGMIVICMIGIMIVSTV